MADACEYGNELSGSMKCGDFLTSCKPVSFSRRTLHHGVSKYIWKLRNMFDILSNKFSIFYNPSEHLAADEVIVKYKGRVIFRQYIPKKHKRFGIKIYKLCDKTGYTYDMTVYLGKDRQRTAQHLTATHATVLELTKKIHGRGHKPYMDNYVSSPDLFHDFATKQIYCCGTVRPNRKGMPQDLGPKIMTRGDLQVRTRGELTAILWRDKRDVRILTNIHDAPAEGDFCDNNGKAIKPQIVADYNRHMGYVDKGDRMTNSYSINRRTWKWTKKLFFHLLDLAVLNSYIFLFLIRGSENFAWRFSDYPNGEFIGTGWTGIECAKVNRKTICCSR